MDNGLADIYRRANSILGEELADLQRRGIPCTGGIWIYDVRSVGIQGDGRAYKLVAEVGIRAGGQTLFDYHALAHLSNRLTNEVPEIGRVAYFLRERDERPAPLL